MARYNIGDKVRTTDVWNNGIGTLIPKGSVVKIEYDSGAMCRCSIQGKEAWYEYEWLGDVIENGVIGSKNNTNADKIRSMSDEELAEFLYGLDHYWDDGQCILRINDNYLNDYKDDILDWLQSKAETEE